MRPRRNWGSALREKSDSKNPGRRDALKKMALGAGAAWLPILGQPETFAGGRSPQAAMEGAESAADWKPLFFDEHQNATVEALTDLIIPATDTPGARAAQVNRYIDLLLNDEDPERQKNFFQGLAWLDARCIAEHGAAFVKLTTGQQTALLEQLADPNNSKREDRPGVRFFEEIKGLTIFGYYTSRIGMEQELQYGGDEFHTEFPGACTHPEHQT